MSTNRTGNPGAGEASEHTTRQEIEKSPRSRCLDCGMIGVSAMVKDKKCVNILACARRQRANAKREPEATPSSNNQVVEPAKKAKGAK